MFPPYTPPTNFSSIALSTTSSATFYRGAITVTITMVFGTLIPQNRTHGNISGYLTDHNPIKPTALYLIHEILRPLNFQYDQNFAAKLFF